MSYFVLDVNGCVVEEVDAYEEAIACYESDVEAYAIESEDGDFLHCKGTAE